MRQKSRRYVARKLLDIYRRRKVRGREIRNNQPQNVKELWLGRRLGVADLLTQVENRMRQLKKIRCRYSEERPAQEEGGATIESVVGFR